MDSHRLQLPIFVLVKTKDFDVTTGTVRVSREFDWLAIVVSGLVCFPLFTTTATLRRFLADQPPIVGGSHGVCCNARQLREILEAINPGGILIDPGSDAGEDDVLDAGIIIAWLRGESDERRN